MKIHRHLYLGGLLAFSLISSSSACTLTAARNENAALRETEQTAVSGARAAETTANQSPVKSIPTVTPAAVAGDYEYDTYTGKKEGYANEMTIGDEGNGKLSVSISATYIYPANGAETFHESEAAGDGQLQGNTAIVYLKDEEDKKCRATLTFAANQATVKIPENCRFNVRLDGNYKKLAAKSKTADGKSADREDSPPEARVNSDDVTKIAFTEITGFLNESSSAGGAKLIIRDVPPAVLSRKTSAKEFSKEFKNLFFLSDTVKIKDQGFTGEELLISQALSDTLAENADSEAVTLRLAATCVEAQSHNVLLAYITKIEGLDASGKVLWTATGENPSKVVFAN